MRKRQGFTLVELLVVITIIGILVGLLLPAVQMAREAGRRATCTNNLKQLALGCRLHEQSQSAFPTGGWNERWLGDPDRGYDRRQPGGWTYNVLPFVGEQALHDVGLGVASADSTRMLNFTARSQTPVPLFYCPSRRRARTYPNPSNWPWNSTRPMDLNKQVAARTDYAANGGSSGTDVWWPAAVAPSSGRPGISGVIGSNNPSLADASDFMWPTMPNSTGIVFATSSISTGEITDGTGFTFLLGEKYADPDYSNTGTDGGDNWPLFSGAHWTSLRLTASNCHSTTTPANAVNRDYLPRQGSAEFRDKNNNSLYYWAFGSAHVGGLNFAMCDGSVRWVSYTIDTITYVALGRRNDSVAIDATKL